MMTWRDEQEAWHRAEKEVERGNYYHYLYVMEAQQAAERHEALRLADLAEYERQSNLYFQWHHVAPLGESCEAAMNIQRLLRASIC